MNREHISQLEAQGFTIVGEYAPLKYLGGVVVTLPNGRRTVVTSVCGHCCHPWSGCVCEED